jgi:tetratricopeptide (TPR) repeat protein
MLATTVLVVGVAFGARAEDDAAAEAAWEAFNRDGMEAAAEADWPAAEAAFRAALEALADDADGGLPALDQVDDDDARLATVAGNLAVVLLQQEELDEARQLFERALGIRRAVLGSRDPAIAESLNNLAELERRSGQLDRARTLHEAALGLRREVLDDGHPDIAESLNNLGVLLRDLGELEAAAGLLGEAHGIRRERLGPVHPATLESTGNLAAVALDLGDRATAEAVLLAAVEALPADAGVGGGMAAYLLRQAVDVLLLENDVDGAVLLCEERVLAGREPSVDAAAVDPLVVPDLVSAELLAACARALGRVGGEVRAARLLEQQLEQLGTSADEAPAIEAELRWGLAETAALAGDLEAAESQLGQVVSLLETRGDQRLPTALNNLGSVRFERGRPLEASADLEAALDLLDDPDVAADPVLRRDVLANYAIVLRTLDRNAEALAVENRLIDLATDPDRIEPAAGD